MIDPVQLHTELTTDPLAVGYAAHLNISDNAVADLLNATTGPGAASITIPQFTKEQFATGVLPAVQALPLATAAIQAKWTPMLNVALAMNTLYYATTAPLLAGLVADGLMSAVQVDAFTKRAGSRAEALFGYGTQIVWQDVARAMGRIQ